MRIQDRSLFPAGGRLARDTMTRIRRAFAALPLPLKIGAVAVLVVFFPVLFPLLVTVFLLAALIYAPVAIATSRRTVAGSAAVAAWAIVLTFALARPPGGLPAPGLLALLALPVLTVAAAHTGTLGRWYAPCRTVAWALALAVPAGALAWRLLPHAVRFIGPVFAWLIACVVLGWRLAYSWQDSRHYGGEIVRAGARGGPGQLPATRPPAAGPGPPSASGADPAQRLAGPGPSGRRLPDRRVAVAAEAVRALAPGDPPGRGPVTGGPAAAQGGAGQLDITVDEAMAELNRMVGLTAVKEQIAAIAASIEAARRRALAGHGAEKPMQHFVFLGPPGTGKTAVARNVARIFYAFGLLDRPEVVEAQRADLIGEYLGATAIKTNELVDSALGGVLFIDEAYSLVNDGDGQGDRFGSEAVQALLKRAEDDRDHLVIILAGYEREMESFLASNPGLTSRFAIRVKFPGYSPAELLALADLTLERKGELLDPDARPVLWQLLEDVGRRRLADELGNGRFVRSLLAKAGQARDVRVMAASAEPSAAELVTLRGADVRQAYGELTTRYRGYAEAPTLDSALAELDALVGLEPVKRQVREIAAQLRVARLRDTHGLVSQPPARHFVFTGPPGTGKTTVARILGRIFAALGLLVRPGVVEAHRADLVGEHLGGTAIKTSKLIDSALGGVLLVDEAYALHNEGYSGGDAFGAEAVATLLRRAEDDRDRLVIVLAGYTADMNKLLRSNPGLASRFGVRIAFPSYTPDELALIAQRLATQAGDRFDDEALPVLAEIFTAACDQGRIDELGNGRFARSLVERASAARDVRVAELGDSVSPQDLTTIAAADLAAAYRGLAS
jgi:AAA+ superfamily predicted ATPase